MTTEPGSVEGILEGIRQSTYEVQTELRLADAGLKEEQGIADILERYAWLYNPETVRQAWQAHRAEHKPERRERLRRVYYYLLDGYLERRAAPLEDEVVSFEMDATAEVDGASVAFYDVPVLLAQEPDFDKRDRLQEASLAVTEQTNPGRSEVMRARSAALAEFGYESPTAYDVEKKRIDYDLLLSRLTAFLSRTERTYTTHMGEWAQRATGRRPGELLGSHHIAYMSGMPGYDAYFRGERLIEVYRRTLGGMGLDPRSQRNIHLDTEDRPAKNPVAGCYVPDPPSEVHLLIKPRGGFEDYESFLHEAGHAQHYANEDPNLHCVDRAIGTSYALTEVYSFLLQFLTLNRAWLRELVGLPEDAAREVAYHARLANLFAARRYAAKLRYELEFYKDPDNEARNRGLYAATLAAATGFRYAPQNYLSDLDTGYYTADYLRAWITEAMLRHHLEGTYGEDWFDHPEAGAFLRGLWAGGESGENEDIARMIGYEPFDTTCLTEQFLALERMGPS